MIRMRHLHGDERRLSAREARMVVVGGTVSGRVLARESIVVMTTNMEHRGAEEQEEGQQEEQQEEDTQLMQHQQQARAEGGKRVRVWASRLGSCS